MESYLLGQVAFFVLGITLILFGDYTDLGVITPIWL